MPLLRNWRKKLVTKSDDKKVPALRFKGFTDDWEQRKLEKMVNFFSGLTYHPHDVRNNGCFVIRSSNIQNNQIVSADDVFVNRSIVNVPNVEQGDIIVVVRNGSRKLIGKHARVLSKMSNTVIGAFMTVLRSDDNSYINALLDSDQFQKEIYKNLGSTINQITTGEFKKMNFMVAKESENKKIGKFFKLVDNLISLQQRKLEQIKLLKKAMLQKILTETDNPYPKLRFFGFSNTWKKYTVNSLFKISRGYVLSTALTEANKSAHNPYPVYSSQTKNNGLMGYYNKYLYENAITWTTDGANAGTVNYRSGKFYCTNVCGVILSDKVDANQLIAEELNTVSKRYVSYVGNPKLMNNVMANIKIIIPDQYKERQQISQLFSRQDVFKDVYQRKQNVLKILKQFLLQNMFI